MPGHLVAAAAAASISLSMVLSSSAYDHGLSTLAILLLRFVALLAVLPLLARRRGIGLGAMPARRRRLAWLVGAVFLCQTGGYLAAIVFIPISLAVLLFYTYPILTSLLQAAVQRRAPRRAEVLAAGLALAGIALTLQVSVATLDLRGVALALGGALAGAVVMVSNEQLLRGAAPLAVSFQSAWGALAVCAVALALGAPLTWPAAAPGWLALSGAIATFVLFYPAMMVAIERIGSVQTALMLNLEPPLTILMAALLLGQPLAGMQWLGAALVVMAVVLAQRAASAERSPAGR